MADSTKRLGYGGSATIDGEQVLITSGGFNTGSAPSYLEPLDIPPTLVSRSRILHADGTEAYGGEITCDVTDAFLTALSTSKLLARRYQFDAGINDGEKAYLLEDCFISSLSISGSPGGIVTASISFVSHKEWAISILVDNAFIRDAVPLGYWHSGNTDVKEWTFSMNQATTPVYGNENAKDPLYIKVGLVDYILEVSTYEAIIATSTINIKTSAFTLTGVTTSEAFSFAGVSDLGGYSHTFETAADAATGSAGVIIT